MATASHLTKEQQQAQGAFYTPEYLAEQMAKKLGWKPGQTILDPCVGKGNLLRACKKVYPKLTDDLLYGIDIDAEAIAYCKAEWPKGHFVVADILKVPAAILKKDEWWAKHEAQPSGKPRKKTMQDWG